MDCIFCKIIKGEIPAEIVYKDDHVMAMLDVNPKAPGHTIIIPKRHAPTVLDLTEEETAHFFKIARRIIKTIDDALHSEGFTLGINHGEASGREVDHLHFHIIPRYLDDKGKDIQSVVNNPPKESLEGIRNKITACLSE